MTPWLAAQPHSYMPPLSPEGSKLGETGWICTSAVSEMVRQVERGAGPFGCQKLQVDRSSGPRYRPIDYSLWTIYDSQLNGQFPEEPEHASGFSIFFPPRSFARAVGERAVLGGLHRHCSRQAARRME